MRPIDIEALRAAAKRGKEMYAHIDFSRNFEPHEFTPNTLHPHVCSKCGRERYNAKYHVQGVTNE